MQIEYKCDCCVGQENKKKTQKEKKKKKIHEREKTKIEDRINRSHAVDASRVGVSPSACSMCVLVLLLVLLLLLVLVLVHRSVQEVHERTGGRRGPWNRRTASIASQTRATRPSPKGKKNQKRLWRMTISHHPIPRAHSIDC
jgi:predicted Holliday junction resolvase-like endonuclease